MNCCSGYNPEEQIDDVQSYESQDNGPLIGVQIQLDSQNSIGGFEASSISEIEHNFDENSREANDALIVIDEDNEDITDDTIDNNQNEVSVKKRAAVWTCINELRSGGAQCIFCDRTFKMQDKSTSNAIRHLQSVHPDEELVKQMIISNKEVKISKKRKCGLTSSSL